jgi:hypothetical protein
LHSRRIADLSVITQKADVADRTLGYPR